VSNGALRIGGNAIWNEWFNGKIDEVRIYDRALSASEIATDMTTPIAAPTAPPPSTTTSVAPDTVLVGDAGVQAGTDSNGAGEAEAFRVDGSASGAASSVHVYLDAGSTATSVEVGLYADAAARARCSPAASSRYPSQARGTPFSSRRPRRWSPETPTGSRCSARVGRSPSAMPTAQGPPS
jgi:hypothetical protein